MSLRDAIETAYYEATNDFLKEADSEIDRLQAGMLIELRESMNELTEYLNPLPELFREVPFERVYPQQDDQWYDRVAAELAIDYQELPFRADHRRADIADLDEELMLLVGWKGAGKTRTLAEFVNPAVEQGNFDEVVVIAGGEISEPAELDPLTESKGDQDLLLLWDDIQKSDPEAFKRGLKRLKQALEDDGDGRSLCVRATLRQEDIERTLPDQWGLDELRRRPDRGSKHEFWQEFTPVELEPLGEEEIRQLVADTVEYFDLSTDEDTLDAFAEQVNKADPTPFYITTVCANAQGTLTERKIRDLPDAAIEVWETTYNEKLDTSQRTILKSLVVADVMNATPGKRFLKAVYEHVYDQERAVFGESLEQLISAGWLSTRRKSRGSALPSKEVVTLHDVRLEAIANQYSIEEDHFHIHNFLLENRRFERLIRRDKNRGARLVAEYTEYVLENTIGEYSTEDARELFDRAIELNEDEPIVHLKYADALTRLGDPPDVLEQCDKVCAYAKDNPEIYQTATNYVARHDPEKAEKLYCEGIDATGYPSLYFEFVGFMEDRDSEQAKEIYREGVDAARYYRPYRPLTASLYESYVAFMRERDITRAKEICQEGIDTTGSSELRELLSELDEEQGE